jgi:hypothetical protein
LDFDIAHARLQLQQLQLFRGELLAAGAVLLDPLQPQDLFQQVDSLLRPSELLLQPDNLLGFG